MPYISKKLRDDLDDQIGFIIDVFEGKDPQGNSMGIQDDNLSGVINYIAFRLIKWYIFSGGISYNRINSAIGILECCKQEVYRTIAAPYEEEKKRENGDVL